LNFQFRKEQHVSLKIYTILGQEVFTLIDDELEPGKYKVIFDAKGLASGTYIYTLRAGKFVESKKLMFVK
jgi:hypothetical protein